MGFFGFFKKKKKTEIVQASSEEILRLGINEIQGWFDKSFSDSLEKSRSQGSDYHSNVMDSFLDVRNAFVSLESAKFVGSERIHAAANMIKDSFVKKAYPIIANIERVSKETGMDFSGLSMFSEEASKTIETLKNTTPKQAILLTRYFKKESDPVITRIKETEEKIKSLKEWLGDEKMLKTSETVKNSVREQLSDLDEMKSLDKKKEDVKEEIAELKEKKQEKESEFLDLLKSKEWKEFNTMGNEIKNIKNEIMKIEYEVTSELSPMKRPLKKMEYVLNKQDALFSHRGFLRGFMQDPFGTIKTKDGEDSLRKFLFTLSGMAHDKKIDLKDKEMERLDSLLEKMVRDIPEMKKKYNELIETRDHMEKTMEDLSKTTSKKDSIEGDVESLSKEITNVEEEIKDITKNQEKLREKIKKDKRETEKLILTDIGRIVEIVG